MQQPEITSDDVMSFILPLGQDGLIVRFGNGYVAHPDKALAFGNQLRDAAVSGIVEVASSLTSVMVRFAPASVSRAELTERLETLLATGSHDGYRPSATRLWTIPVSFGGADGPQLQEAADIAGLSVADAIAEIAETEVSVMAIGFAPGQPYLGHLGPHWDMPRQQNLTPKVPAGALVTALRQFVLFANPSPTGWRWIGTCAFAPFKADREEPFALRASDRIRFVPTDPDRLTALRKQDPDGLGGAECQLTQ